MDFGVHAGLGGKRHDNRNNGSYSGDNPCCHGNVEESLASILDTYWIIIDHRCAWYCGGVVLKMINKEILEEIGQERDRQVSLWGEQNHDPFKWLAILGEEYGEACKAALEQHFPAYPRTSNYREELIQVAAVAVAAIDSLDRREGEV